ncbi:MAG: hypothetical protein II181_05985 [Firmicutes bacterium]|nr:hypothetical protein [Bacillota bacterium]MBQ1648373.1 hypothetical protein [Bacteroidales bacterium]MBQ2305623.1 hypothetical protein [Bacillota bacterium]
MERSSEQKALGVFSVLALIFGIIGIIFGVAVIAMSGLAVGNAGSLISDVGVTAEQIGMFSGLFIGMGIILILSGIFNLINWRALKKVSRDATKYKMAMVVTIISLVFAALSLGAGFFSPDGNQAIASGIFSVVWNLIILFLVNKVKNSVHTL